MIAELVGHYRIVASLGSGGMGVVWKAIDTRLNRPVALKALRDSHAGSTEAVLRLRAEALSAASLDHPYICKIYELLETGTATMVVMEFVEGETLGDILVRRVPQLGDTLRYGSEIAEGLANAHARGIVHRDIKPSNVMVTPHNHIKLLDFGIARATPTGDTETQSGNGLTLPGDAPGTPQYMAPEQALGRTIDGRTDLFSLGVVMFRCLTGQLPFEGNTRDEYVQQMLSGAMRSIDELAPDTPYQVRDIVKACLQRDPDKRPDSAAIVADTLRRSADALSTGSLPIASAPPSGLQRWGLQVALLAFAMMAGVFALLQWSIRPAEDEPGELRPAVTWPSAELDARISPDAKWLSFISDKQNQSRVYVKSLDDSGNALPVDIQGEVRSHAWSPNGRELACVVRQGQRQFLVVVPAFFGGSPRTSVPLEERADDVAISRWVGDVVYIRLDRGATGRSLSAIDLTTGRTEDLTAKWPTKLEFRNPQVSPNGQMVVLDAYTEGRSDLWTARLDGSGLQRLTDDASVDRYPIWIGNDSVAFQSNRAGQLDLWRIALSSRRSTQLLSSQQEEIAADATADGGTIAFEQLSAANSLWRLDLVTGGTRQLTGDALGDYWPSVSETGGRIVFQRTRPKPQEGFQFLDAQVLSATLANSALETSTVGEGFAPLLSSDGSWVAYYQRLPGVRRLRVLAKNLANGELRTLSDEGAMPAITAPRMPVDRVGQTMAWSPAGADLFYLALTDAGPQVHRADLRASTPPAIVARGSAGVTFRDVYVSPAGRAVAWIAASKDRLAVEVLELPSTRRSIPITKREPSAAHYLSGWTSERSMLLTRSHWRGVDYEIQLAELGMDGAERGIAAVSDAPVPTVLVDSHRSRAILTRHEEGVHNVYAVSLRDGSKTRITANETQGISFSGIQSLRADVLVYAREERKRDIWLVQRKPGN